MKQKIRVVGTDGKVLESENTIRDFAHFEAQQKYRSNVFIETCEKWLSKT